VIGAAVILWPVLLLKLKSQPYFRVSGGGDTRPARKAAKKSRKVAG
jgi:hypothetical protein